jgi:Protein of unknown function (DUF2934)
MNNPREQDAKALGQFANQGSQQEGGRPSGQDRQEQYQRTKEHAQAADENRQIGSASARPDPDNNLGRGTPGDREDRIRQRAYEIWEQEGRPEGQDQRHWERAAQNLDREDSNVQRDSERRH